MSRLAGTPTKITHGDRRGALSCAECRRSKLKCDRSIPCSSCVRRGCSDLCPDRTLTATKGNKVLMAHAQRLEVEVRTMKSKIKQLEDALANAQLNPKPSQEVSALHIKSPQDYPSSISAQPSFDEVDEVVLSMGPFSIGTGEKGKHQTSFIASEYLTRMLMEEELDESTQPEIHPSNLGLSPELVELTVAFPYGIRDCKYSKILFAPFMPSKQTALHFVDLYYQYASWLYEPVSREDFDTLLLSTMYGIEETASLDAVHPHRLSVFFVILAMGATFDDNASFAAEQFHALSTAALSLLSIADTVSLPTLQALFLLCYYTYTTKNPTDESRWLLFGVCTRAAQMIDLQRDAAHVKLEAGDLQRRRILFWEMYTWDSWSSFINARPCTFKLEEIQCHFPEDPGFVSPGGEVELTFRGWKFRYSAICISQTLRLCMAQKPPEYSLFLELDRRIRIFPVPTSLHSPVDDSGYGWPAESLHAIEQYVALMTKETNLLYLHRSFFAQAIRDSPDNPLGHKYSTSVSAAYRSALRIITGIHGLYKAHPKLTSVTWYPWTAVFSSCFILGGIVIESPSCYFASPALQELERTVPLFIEGSAKCKASHGTPALLEKLLLRAQTVYISFQNKLEPAPSYFPDEPDHPDEVVVIAGSSDNISNSLNSGGTSAYSTTHDSTAPAGMHVPDIGYTYNMSAVNPADLLPDINMHFLSSQSFMARSFDFGHPVPRSTAGASDQIYLQEPQYAYPVNYSSPNESSNRTCGHDVTYYPRSPHQVWVNFMQQLTADGYNAPPP